MPEHSEEICSTPLPTIWHDHLLCSDCLRIYLQFKVVLLVLRSPLNPPRIKCTERIFQPAYRLYAIDCQSCRFQLPLRTIDGNAPFDVIYKSIFCSLANAQHWPLYQTMYFIAYNSIDNVMCACKYGDDIESIAPTHTRRHSHIYGMSNDVHSSG